MALAALIALTYALAHLTWYLGTPLGRVPVLDERENLDLAAAIYGGALPAAPFYRAPGYALALAGLRTLGVSAAALFPAALLLGAVLHAFNAGLVAALSHRFFGGRAGLIAGLLFALDPVLVHYATQALDATLSLTLFLAGLVFLASALGNPARSRAWIGASLGWAAATLVRPNSPSSRGRSCHSSRRCGARRAAGSACFRPPSPACSFLARPPRGSGG